MESIKRRMLRIFEEGPATSGEVAVELGMTLRLVNTHLYQLRVDEKVRHTGGVIAKPFGQRGSDFKLLEITARGRASLRGELLGGYHGRKGVLHGERTGS